MDMVIGDEYKKITGKSAKEHLEDTVREITGGWFPVYEAIRVIIDSDFHHIENDAKAIDLMEGKDLANLLLDNTIQDVEQSLLDEGRVPDIADDTFWDERFISVTDSWDEAYESAINYIVDKYIPESDMLGLAETVANENLESLKNSFRQALDV